MFRLFIQVTGFNALWEAHLSPPHTSAALNYLGAPSMWHVTILLDLKPFALVVFDLELKNQNSN